MKKHQCSEVDWVTDHVANFMSEKFLDETLTPPLPLPPVKPDAEQTMPPEPSLTVLVYNNKAKSAVGLKSLKTPDKVLQQWHDHNQWGKTFQEFLQKAREQFPLDLPSCEKGPGKRIADGEPNTKPDPKRINRGGPLDFDPLPQSLHASLPDIPLIHQTPVVSMKCIEVVITVGHKIFLINTGNEPVLMKRGSTVAGFYKGKWWVANEQNAAKGNAEKDLLFELKDSETMVFYGNALLSLGEVIRAKRATSPADAHIGFHDLVDAPRVNEPAFFKVTLKHKAYFNIGDVPASTDDSSGKTKVTCQNLAGVVPVSCWQSWCTGLVWAMRWSSATAKGLQPIRPYIVMSRNVTLPAKGIIELIKPVDSDQTKDEQDAVMKKEEP